MVFRQEAMERMLGLAGCGLRWLVAMVACGVAASGQPRGSPGPYTGAQATAGRLTYQAMCASCHLADLGGRNEAPPLAGANFMNVWGSRTTSDLLKLIQSSMPPGSRGHLDDDTCVNLVAFLLEANGSR